jgi:hypothetical protein
MGNFYPKGAADQQSDSSKPEGTAAKAPEKEAEKDKDAAAAKDADAAKDKASEKEATGGSGGGGGGKKKDNKKSDDDDKKSSNWTMAMTTFAFLALAFGGLHAASMPPGTNSRDSQNAPAQLRA